MIEKSKNQYSSNIVAISKFNKALNKALDKASVKHSTKQIVKQGESIDSIIKQIYIIQNNQYTIEQAFDLFWNLYDNKKDSKKARDKFLKLKEQDIYKIFESVEKYVKSTPDKKYRKNPTTWINGECWNDVIEETKNKENQNGIKQTFNTKQQFRFSTDEAIKAITGNS